MRIAALTVAIALFASAAPDAQSVAKRQTTWSVQDELLNLPSYGVFDFLAFDVDNGKVTLSGYTYNSSLKSRAARVVKRVRGVDEVANHIEELPPSSHDDRVRWATFYRIYGDGSLSRYSPGGSQGALSALYDARRFPGMQPFGVYPIHIIVKNGRTTLYGAVGSELDKRIAEVRAREVGGVFAVDNRLVVDRS